MSALPPSPEGEAPKRSGVGAGRFLLGALGLSLVVLGVILLLVRGRERPPQEAPLVTTESGSLEQGGAAAAGPNAAGGSRVDAGVIDAGLDGGSEQAAAADEAEPKTLDEQKEALLAKLARAEKLSDEKLARVRAIVFGTRWLSQGNPDITAHPMTRGECRSRRQAAAPLPPGDARCGAPNMVPLYDRARGQSDVDAKVCIDQYEFPNIACEYPVVYARAVDAVELCRALDKRICDAHEWEGACAGALRDPETEYAFGERRMMIEYLHNQKRELTWAYGPKRDHSLCATQSRKSPKCYAGGWTLCGSNTYPAGAFPSCRSGFGVFDLHGNAAEHMNLPLTAAQLASRGGLGETEMKGSWFIFSRGEVHPDDCRWRAPMWHHTRIDDANSHANYHLGFRCCRDIRR